MPNVIGASAFDQFADFLTICAESIKSHPASYAIWLAFGVAFGLWQRARRHAILAEDRSEKIIRRNIDLCIENQSLTEAATRFESDIASCRNVLESRRDSHRVELLAAESEISERSKQIDQLKCEIDFLTDQNARVLKRLDDKAKPYSLPQEGEFTARLIQNGDDSMPLGDTRPLWKARLEEELKDKGSLRPLDFTPMSFTMPPPPRYGVWNGQFWLNYGSSGESGKGKFSETPGPLSVELRRMHEKGNNHDWLVARIPDDGGQPSKSDIVYQFKPPRAPSSGLCMYY